MEILFWMVIMFLLGFRNGIEHERYQRDKKYLKKMRGEDG